MGYFTYLNNYIDNIYIILFYYCQFEEGFNLKIIFGKNLVERYRENYCIPASVNINEEMVLHHCVLEKQLANELINSTPENRWEVFDSCYTKLYSELKWLNKPNEPMNIPLSYYFKEWVDIIGAPPLKIYEVGSGKGELLTYLSSIGHMCKGTEITRERGEKHVNDDTISWGISDGTHLDKFEPLETYDVVISNNVIEHMHPDDLLDHFSSVCSILNKGGRYVFLTPHKHIGPSDVSRVFKSDRCQGMHLKEYTYRELATLLTKAGYKNIKPIPYLPLPIKRLLYQHRNYRGNKILSKTAMSPLSLNYQCMLESVIRLLPYQSLRRRASIISMLAFFKPNIFIEAKK